MLVATLWQHRTTDTYRRDNLLFLIVLPTFLVAKNALLSEAHLALGLGMTQGLFRLAFLIMLERTLTEFMRNVFGISIWRAAWLDRSIKGLGLAAVFLPLMPSGLASACAATLAGLLLLRLSAWAPLKACSRIDIGIMFAGYGALTLQLLLEAWSRQSPLPWVGSVSVHLFSFGVMGLIIPAMLIRICHGHTGRKVSFGARERWALRAMLLAMVLRLVAPQWFPAAYLHWVGLSALVWSAVFAVLGVCYIPWLFQARVDGREH